MVSDSWYRRLPEIGLSPDCGIITSFRNSAGCEVRVVAPTMLCPVLSIHRNGGPRLGAGQVPMWNAPKQHAPLSTLSWLSKQGFNRGNRLRRIQFRPAQACLAEIAGEALVYNFRHAWTSIPLRSRQRSYLWKLKYYSRPSALPFIRTHFGQSERSVSLSRKSSLFSGCSLADVQRNLMTTI
jgi:hypothetical protein